MLVKPGDSVVKGQLLVQLDAADTSTAVLAAQSTVDHNKALMADKQRILVRNQILAKDDLIAQQVLTASQADSDAAQADYRSALASLQQARINLARTDVRAPFDGIVSARKAQPGMYATPGTVLVSVNSRQPASLQFKAPERLLPVLKKGAPLIVDVDGTSVETKVRAVSPVIDPSSRNFAFEADIPSGAALLAPGHSLVARVELGQTESPSVPEKAVQSVGSEDFVYVVQGGKAHRVSVSTGVREDGFAQLLTPLEPHVQVIADGANFVSEGQSVSTGGGN
ncbi:hypothetical protein AS149_14160 [Burkholderia cenocepacia]|nr:hypothetical protein AS149_14160 [Burkholderia cenocepacia]